VFRFRVILWRIVRHEWSGESTASPSPLRFRRATYERSHRESMVQGSHVRAAPRSGNHHRQSATPSKGPVAVPFVLQSFF